MRVTILSVGHKMPAWIQEGFHEYQRRMPPEIRVELTELKPDKTKADEGKRILAALPDGATLLALDERGKAISTQGLSVMLSEWMRDASPVSPARSTASPTIFRPTSASIVIAI